MKKTNPFYGLVKLKSLYDCRDDRKPLNSLIISEAYNEAKAKGQDAIELFFVILIAFGDIDRQHNIFERKRESGGFALRDKFRMIMLWLKQYQPDYYTSLLYNDIFVEYVGWDTLLKLQVNTVKKTEKVKRIVRQFDQVDVDILAKYIASWIMRHKSDAHRSLLAKQLVRIDGRKRKLEAADQNVAIRKALYDKLSELMEFEIDGYGNHLGLYEWRKKYIANEEYYLFSTGKILSFDKIQFVNWINSIASEARRRVKKRIKNNEKYSKLYEYYLEWEESKKKLQAEKRVLEAKAKEVTRGLTIEEKVRLEQLKKDAKVNTGASQIFDEFTKFLSSSDTNDFNLRSDSILDKTDIRVPLLMFIDNSASMRYVTKAAHTVSETACILATIMGLKNPAREDLFIRFGTEAQVVGVNQKLEYVTNRFGANSQYRTVKELLNPEDDFYTNFSRMNSLFYPNMGGTQLNSVFRMFKLWADNAHKKEQIMEYQTFLVFSDGHFNEHPDAIHDVRHFMHNMKATFGWEGVLVLWDLQSKYENRKSFDGIENVIHYVGWNPNIVNQIMCNIHDLEVIDSYTELLSLYRSDRYDLVKRAVQ